MKCLFNILCFGFLMCTLEAQNITHAEYFFNTDPGPGNATLVDVPDDDTLSAAFNVPLGSLPVGFHQLAVRVRYDNGVWSAYQYRNVYIAPAPTFMSDIVDAEYFFDTDPGPGNGTAISIGPTGSPVAFMPMIPQSFTEGLHMLAIRVRDMDGRWSFYEKRMFYISPAPVTMGNIVAAEYYFDTDPGPGNGIPISVDPSGATVNFTAMIPASLGGGFHFLAIRVKDQNGIWSYFEKRNFYLSPPPVTSPDISAAEFFLDQDPGPGDGTPLSVGASGDTLMPNHMIPIHDTTALGEYVFTYRVIDTAGSWSHFVYDTIIVAISVPPDTTLDAEPGMCTIIVNGLDPEVINNEPITYQLTGATTGSGSGSSSGLTFNAGVTTVTYTLVNFPTAFASFTVTVSDTELSMITCPANITVNSDVGICGAVFTYNVTFTDNCPGAILTQENGLESGSTFPTGITTNTFRITDASGNSVTCSFTVTVLDNILPVLNCPSNITVNTGPGSCGAVVNYTVSVDDNCPGETLLQTSGLASGEIFPKGITTNTFQATDAAGNTTTCSFTITVVDNEFPTLTCPASITVNHEPGTCHAIVNYNNPVFSDNCPGVMLSQTSGLISGSAFPVGTTINTFVATDDTGNTATCSFTVTVIDNEFPVITCPANINQPSAPGLCGRIVSYTVPFSDNCPGAVLQQTAGLPTGSIFPIGTTINSFIITDASGNSATCSFMVTIVDNELPTLLCPANLTVNMDAGICGTLVSYNFFADDNCPGEIVSQTAGLPTGSIFPVGVTFNSFLITDASGNTATCSFTITVVDNEDPEIDCPEDMIVNAHPDSSGATVFFTITTDDNCPGEMMIQTTGLPSGSFYPIDTTTNTFVVTDASGNTSTCSFDIIVINNPIFCPNNTTVSAPTDQCSAAVSGIDPTTNPPGQPVQYMLSGATTGSGSGSASGLTFNVGVTSVLYSLTSQPAFNCSFLVTVQDTQPPFLFCQEPIVMNAEPGLCHTLVNYVVTTDDNCPGLVLMQTNGLPSGSLFPVGVTTNSFTLTDANGNTSTCSSTVTIVDNQPPTLTCPANITVNTDSGLCTASNVSLGTPITADNCGIASTTNNGLSNYPMGVTNVMWTTTDVNGLTATCIQTVTVLDVQPPSITVCPPDIETTTDPGDCGAVVNFTFEGTDNCTLTSLVSTSFQSGEQIPTGLHTVTILATDNSGNTSTCSFTILVLDDESPEINCPGPISIATSPGACTRVVDFIINANDNCSPLSSLVSVPSSGSLFPVGTTIVTSTATDMSGNSQSCTFTVTVEDEEMPTLECPPPITVNTDAGLCTASGVSLGSPVTNTDNCGIASTMHNGPSIFPKGITQVVWTTTDVHGNSKTCAQSVTVIDNQPPIITCPGDMTVFAGPGPSTIVNYPSPVFSDNCPFANMMQTTGLPSGSAFPVGNTTNTFVATDANGLTASCSFTITLLKGKVGVNTTAPQAMLHVKDSSVLFSAPSPLPVSPGPLPVQGPGTRMMWYPDKGAFRSGTVTGTHWNRDSIGYNSIAVGNDLKAIGYASAAIGGGSIARDSFSFAAGLLHLVDGTASAAFGQGHFVTGDKSIAFNQQNTVSGHQSAAFGQFNSASGTGSFVTGISNTVLSDYSMVAGLNHVANAFASLTMGRYADTLAASRTAWVDVDPLWVVGNGTSGSQRRTALTLLKNGRLGIGTKSPLFRLHHVTNDAGSGGIVEGILVESIPGSVGQAGISFRNPLLPGTRQWMFGVRQNTNLSFHYHPFASGGSYKIGIDTLGNVGIGKPTPLAPLHVVRISSSGGVIPNSRLAVFESLNNFTYLFFSSQTGKETGILSGNQVTAQRSGIIFAADSILQLSAGGDSTRLHISKSNMVGIATTSPDAKLDVNGTVQLGNNGSTLQEIMRVTVNINLPMILNNTTHLQNVSITGVSENSVVIVSPGTAMPHGMILTGARVSGSGNVVFRIVNDGAGSLDLAAMDFHFGIIR